MKKKAQGGLRLGTALLCFAVCASNVRAQDHMNPEVDKAIDRGLEFLSKSQTQEGFFNGEFGKSPGVVSLAGMAFLAKGHTPGYGVYGATLNTCIDYILKYQQPNGMLDRQGESGGNGAMYAHNISTLFLSEITGMVDPERQKKVDQALPKALKIILDAQNLKKDQNHSGGWRYAINSGDSDLSCSGWALMALRSARHNGAPVPMEAIDNAVKYLMVHFKQDTGQFGYQDQQQWSVTLTGAGLLCLELTGHHGEESTIKAANYVLQTYEQMPGQERAYYGNYYNAQAMFQIGGKYWDKFSKWMYTPSVWLKTQKEDGSWVREYGPYYGTSMMVLALTVPYRQLPIYQRDETVDEKDK